MYEVLEVNVWAPKGRAKPFNRFISSWAARGYVIEPGPTPFAVCRSVKVPLGDKNWKHELEKAVAAGDIKPDWSADTIEQIYSKEEIAHAPLFSIIHTGRCISFRSQRDHISRASDIVGIERGDACTRCGVGAHQVGPIRLPAAELNRAGRFASIWLPSNTYFFVADSLRREIEAECDEKIPVLKIQPTGASRLKEAWWQLTPKWSIPEDWVLTRRYRKLSCRDCGARRLTCSIDPFGAYCSLKKSRFNEKKLPPILTDPFWEGDVDHDGHGKIDRYPMQRLWLRGDVARYLAKSKISRLYLTPIMPV